MKTNSLHVISSIDYTTGGLGTFVCGLCSKLADYSNIVTILTAETAMEHQNLLSERVRLQKVNNKSLSSRFLQIGFRSSLQKLLESDTVDIVHSHSIWLPCGHHASAFSHRYKLPFVISTHGSLAPWALNYRGWKKRIALAVYQQKDFSMADGFHATAMQESENLRSFGIQKPIAIIPIGVTMPVIDEKRNNGKVDGPKTALFLSRIHPVKGILKLLDVWADIRPTSWRLVIAGNDDQNHLRVVMENIRRLGLDDNVIYAGALFGKEKDQLFRKADLFILPSYSENFGIVVAEALSYGVPVITTDGTPWKDLREHNCGWYTGTDRESLGDALTDALSQPDDSLREKGRRGRILIENKYQWKSIARDMNLFYLWLRGYGDRPDFVMT